MYEIGEISTKATVIIPLSIVANLVTNDDNAVDSDVNGYDLGVVVSVAVHGPDDTFAGTHHQADGAVQVVHPAWSGLLIRWSYWNDNYEKLRLSLD